MSPHCGWVEAVKKVIITSTNRTEEIQHRTTNTITYEEIKQAHFETMKLFITPVGCFGMVCFSNNFPFQAALPMTLLVEFQVHKCNKCQVNNTTNVAHLNAGVNVVNPFDLQPWFVVG